MLEQRRRAPINPTIDEWWTPKSKQYVFVAFFHSRIKEHKRLMRHSWELNL